MAISTSPRAAVVVAAAAPTASLLPAQAVGTVMDDTSMEATADRASATYANPVSAGVVDTFPDPATIRGKDGAWYIYGTQNPIFNSAS